MQNLRKNLVLDCGFIMQPDHAAVPQSWYYQG